MKANASDRYHLKMVAKFVYWNDVLGRKGYKLRLYGDDTGPPVIQIQDGEGHWRGFIEIDATLEAACNFLGWGGPSPHPQK